jgi:pSer/pThr/pTyr-binding forkhead associated (FHA) protein
MAARSPEPKKGLSADWLVRGVLTRLGDTLDRFTGRSWTPTSSIATSELIERIKKLLDAEAREVKGKGTVVPHNIKLRMQWDKFSTDSEAALEALQNELLIAAVDHINDSLYYTYAPVTLDVKPDYFIEGVKLMVSFEQFTEDARDVELNVTMPAINVASVLDTLATSEPKASGPEFIAHFQIGGVDKEANLSFLAGQSRSVGRTGGNDLILDDTSVSKTHASLALNADGKLAVADTGSTNGTFVNEERIAYGKAVDLAEGDKVRFGTVTVTFELIPVSVVHQDPEGGDDDATDTVEIGGFEFRGRQGPETPAAEQDSPEPVSVPVGAKDTAGESPTESTVSNAGQPESPDLTAPSPAPPEKK